MWTSNGWLADMNDSVSPMIDETFGEAVRIIPTVKRPNMQPTPHPEHAVEVLAGFLGARPWRSGTNRH